MLHSLISGSNGNCSLFSSDGTNILIDCGMSGRQLEAQLKKLDLAGNDISAILVTHEHLDHIKGIGVVSRRYDIPVFATEQTHIEMAALGISDKNRRIISPDRLFDIDKVTVDAFSIPHDAADPVGYRLYEGNEKYAVATDIGTMTNELFDSLSGSRALILEANHDVEMLINGCYPEHLKQRILGTFGHMSNDLSAKTVVALANRGTKQVMLAHLSEENNKPKIAFDTVSTALKDAGADKGDIELIVAKRYEVTSFC